jgi:hypothetical protein
VYAYVTVDRTTGVFAVLLYFVFCVGALGRDVVFAEMRVCESCWDWFVVGRRRGFFAELNHQAASGAASPTATGGCGEG